MLGESVARERYDDLYTRRKNDYEAKNMERPQEVRRETSSEKLLLSCKLSKMTMTICRTLMTSIKQVADLRDLPLIRLHSFSCDPRGGRVVGDKIGNPEFRKVGSRLYLSRSLQSSKYFHVFFSIFTPRSRRFAHFCSVPNLTFILFCVVS